MPDVVVVTGTGTEVGKTWVAAGILRALGERGLRWDARKPVQSFEPGAGPTDADILARACSGRSEDVCPPHRSYPAPVAPPIAARRLGLPVPTLAELVAEFGRPRRSVLVEGVGGPRSPLAADADTGDLARALGARRTVLVAHPGLGTINDVRLASDALSGLEVVVFLNRFDPSDPVHRENLDWLRTRDRFCVHSDVDALATTLVAATPLEVT